ncbi:uncharacterized protein LOC129569460 [Sitodiplosis mosellana]|uniref:uncharacterized protein LOC129569460 n=1 Tax=Sitodiplosis mosellana TaxID=263140 RepID=UPI002444E639|nr:uncharacterized protein LOC129569460 [Sitodiplosis mosellana]
MKLFIWNDYEWRLIEASDDYDKENFYIVRKLFVQWPKEGNAVVCNDLIRQHFESYGTVESVHTVNEESIDANAINAADIHEAYVTFVDSEHAYNGFLANRRDSKAIKVLPADTWRQPGVDVVPFETIKAINDSNPCSKEKFNFYDVMKDFGECGEVVPTVHLRQPMGLKSIIESFRPIKNRISHFKIIFDIEPNDTHVNCLTDDESIKRAVQILCTCIGEQFNELTIWDAKKISIELLDNMALMLQRLESLTLQTESNASVLYALPEYCPNLRSLELLSLSWDGECLDSEVKNWPSISELMIAGNVKIASDTETGVKFQRFIELNPQLDQLELDTIVDNGTFTKISEQLPNLMLLEFVRETYDDIELILDQLTQMKHLTEVKISILLVEKDGLKAMATCAERFREMEQLKLITLFQNLEPDTVQEEEYKRIFSCAVTHHHGCSCHESERVLEICDVDDEMAMDKKAMVKLPKSRPVLVVCVNTKNYFDSADMELMQKVSIGIEGTKQFYPHVIDKRLVDGTDNYLSFHISHA